MSDHVDILVRNLDIVFRRIQPEKLFHELMAWEGFGVWAADENVLSANHIPANLFMNAAKSSYPGLSHEERQCIYNMMYNVTRPNAAYRIPSYASIFAMVLEASHVLLTYTDNRLYARLDNVLAWDQLYRFLGQDLFTTAYLAYHDNAHEIHYRSFLWAPVLATDNRALHQKLHKGIAENHMHLGGSSQCFPIFWAYIMNHPQKIHNIDQYLNSNKQSVLIHGAEDAVESWEQRLAKAAWLRAKLMLLMQGVSGNNMKRNSYTKPDDNEGIENPGILKSMENRFDWWSDLGAMVDTLRYQFGMAVPQGPESNVVLDYALQVNMLEAKEHHNRILAGERSFLYHSFSNIFSGKWQADNTNAFFLYLQIKACLRTEFIQANQEVGFNNFKEYQDRKAFLYKEDPAYIQEMVRLAINGNIADYSLICMEARFAPANSSEAFRKEILLYDRFVRTSPAPNVPYYYVLHFIKNPKNIAQTYVKFNEKPTFITLCRNHENRWKVYHTELAVRLALDQYPILRTRLLGIDAASTEIGCPPEVFSHAFRRLRNWLPSDMKTNFYENYHCTNECVCSQLKPNFLPWEEADRGQKISCISDTFQSLGVTYHVGEDFMDIADGLRMIDEAIRFLPLKRNDRIGHALALGVSPEKHYELKGNRSVLPRQMLLDNLVWLLCRAHELDISLRGAMEKKLRTKTEQLLQKLYYPNQTRQIAFYDELRQRNDVNISTLDDGIPFASVEDYFHSWMLRADPPHWYMDLRYNSDQHTFLPSREFEEIPEDGALDIYRKNPIISRLYGMYHYSTWTREQGAVCEEFCIDNEYIRLMRDVQDKMQGEIARKGIMIECNPTSNYLIGTFRDYNQHPIFRFHNINADDNPDMHHLKVSINTDDLGVFDTSLENEYVMIGAALSQQTDENGERKYSDVRIEKYLDSIRKMGLEQTFCRL